MKKFFSGFMVALLLVALTTSSFATPISKALNVNFNGIKVLVDGAKVNFGKDTKGNVIEPFVYNGTTYLPLKAVANALGKSVEWDGSSQTVYVGDRPGKVKYLIDTLEPYALSTGFSAKNQGVFHSNDGNSFMMGGTKYTNGYRFSSASGGYANFNLNGQYDTISGDLGVQYFQGAVGNKYTVKIYLDGELYKTVEIVSGDLPIKLEIPVSGVSQFEITFPRVSETVFGFGEVIIK